MKKYIVALAAIGTTSALLPSTGVICTNLNAYAKDSIVKQSAKCKGTGTGMSSPGLLNAKGDQVRFSNIPAAHSNGKISTDMTVSVPIPAIGSMVVEEFTPTESNFKGKTVQVMFASYSVTNAQKLPAGTPSSVAKEVLAAAKASKTDGDKSMLKIFRRIKPMPGGVMMYRTQDPLWTEGVTVFLKESDPSMLGLEQFVIHPNGEVTFPSQNLELDFAKPLG
jgi:hypothetical protein